MNSFRKAAPICLTVAALSVAIAATPTADGQAPDQPQDEAVQQKNTTWKASGKRGGVAAGGQGAVDAGMTILKADGNAMDAAAATILALSVTDSGSFCFGGEVPIMVYDAKRDVTEVLCGQGVAPKLATQEFFAKKSGGIPGKGITPAAVPGAFDAVITTLDRYGTKTFAECVAPTLKLLDKGGKDWHANLARTLRRMVEVEKTSPNDRKRGLRLVADYFYRGPIAKEIDAFCKANGGLIRYTDMATHVTRIEDPVTIDYRGHKIVKCGVWTQGPYLLQTMKMLEGFDLGAMGFHKADSIHVAAEALKLGLADRDKYFADPLFADVPLKELLSDEYIALRRPLIDMKKASQIQRPGDPRKMLALHPDPKMMYGPGEEDYDTTTCVVADGQGNVVAATPSGFSGVVAGNTGIYLSTRLQQFNAWAGHPNCIEPGKRPRITLTPGMVFKNGKPLLSISVAGGDMQDQCALQLITNHIDFGFNAADCVSLPRFGTNHFINSFRQKAPKLGNLNLHSEMKKEVIDELKNRGHKVNVNSGVMGANPVMIRIDPVTRVIDAAGDPKAKRHAGAW
ncbi:MAG TPA: gamma-glutamyltransferase [Gemmataceae bacterium]|nr:gamma-glutamyltransferase [Gemmataceae bacterium]